MSDTLNTLVDTDSDSLAIELGKAIVIGTARAAAETAGAVMLLAAVGLVANKVQTRRAKKLAPKAE